MFTWNMMGVENGGQKRRDERRVLCSVFLWYRRMRRRGLGAINRGLVWALLALEIKSLKSQEGGRESDVFTLSFFTN